MFLNTVKQSKLSEEDINGWHPAQFDRNQKKIRQNILTMFDSQAESTQAQISWNQENAHRFLQYSYILQPGCNRQI